MREIKFKVWNPYRKSWAIEFAIVWHGDGSYIFEYAKGKDWETHTDFEGFIIVQYTGLKDRNGKEIYKGDRLEEAHDTIMENKSIKSIVIWDNDRSMFRLNCHQNIYLGAEDAELYLEVTGNIYENPELIKGK